MTRPSKRRRDRERRQQQRASNLGLRRASGEAIPAMRVIEEGLRGWEAEIAKSIGVERAKAEIEKVRGLLRAQALGLIDEHEFAERLSELGAEAKERYGLSLRNLEG